MTRPHLCRHCLTPTTSDSLLPTAVDHFTITDIFIISFDRPPIQRSNFNFLNLPINKIFEFENFPVDKDKCLVKLVECHLFTDMRHELVLLFAPSAIHRDIVNENVLKIRKTHTGALSTFSNETVD